MTFINDYVIAGTDAEMTDADKAIQIKRYESTVQWLNLSRTQSKKILGQVDQFYPDLSLTAHEGADIDHDAEPINILCMDCGGMKGYAFLAMLQIISEEYCRQGQDFFEQFHFIAGTCTGGVTALLLNAFDSVEDFLLESRDCFDDIREQISSGNKKVKEVLEKKLGVKTPLANKKVPAMALCAVREKSGSHIPFIVRTYDYPSSEKNKVAVESSSSMTVSEAIAASCTLVASDVVKIKTENGKKKETLISAGKFCKCPMATVLSQVFHLYPGRPLGVVLSLGTGMEDKALINRSIETARLSHPDLYYMRIEPSEIIKKYNYVETDLQKIAVMEEEIHEYVKNNVRVRNGLKVALEKLFNPRNPEWRNSRKGTQVKEGPLLLQEKYMNRFLARSVTRHSAVSKNSNSDSFISTSSGQSRVHFDGVDSTRSGRLSLLSNGSDPTEMRNKLFADKGSIVDFVPSSEYKNEDKKDGRDSDCVMCFWQKLLLFTGLAQGQHVNILYDSDDSSYEQEEWK